MRQKPYKQFIDETSKLYADALVHDEAEISALVRIYALISRCACSRALLGSITRNVRGLRRMCLNFGLIATNQQMHRSLPAHNG